MGDGVLGTIAGYKDIENGNNHLDKVVNQKPVPKRLVTQSNHKPIELRTLSKEEEQSELQKKMEQEAKLIA